MPSRAQQREIVRADAERRIARDVDLFLQLVGHGDPPRERQDVLANHHRDIRVSPRFKGWPTRVVGIAPGTEDTSDGTPTVLVTQRDGSSEVRTVASFRKGRKSAPRATDTTPRQTEVQRYGLVNNIGQDYS